MPTDATDDGAVVVGVNLGSGQVRVLHGHNLRNNPQSRNWCEYASTDVVFKSGELTWPVEAVTEIAGLPPPAKQVRVSWSAVLLTLEAYERAVQESVFRGAELSDDFVKDHSGVEHYRVVFIDTFEPRDKLDNGDSGAGPSSEDEEGASEDSEGEGYDRSDEEEEDNAWSRFVARDEASGAAFDEQEARRDEWSDRTEVASSDDDSGDEDGAATHESLVSSEDEEPDDERGDEGVADAPTPLLVVVRLVAAPGAPAQRLLRGLEVNESASAALVAQPNGAPQVKLPDGARLTVPRTPVRPLRVNAPPHRALAARPRLETERVLSELRTRHGVAMTGAQRGQRRRQVAKIAEPGGAADEAWEALARVVCLVAEGYESELARHYRLGEGSTGADTRTAKQARNLTPNPTRNFGPSCGPGRVARAPPDPHRWRRSCFACGSTSRSRRRVSRSATSSTTTRSEPTGSSPRTARSPPTRTRWRRS